MTDSHSLIMSAAAACIFPAADRKMTPLAEKAEMIKEGTTVSTDMTVVCSVPKSVVIDNVKHFEVDTYTNGAEETLLFATPDAEICMRSIL